MEEIVEYTLIFKEDTELYKAYDGEFISEDRADTDDLFEKFQEQVEQYYEKTWVRYTSRNEDSDWYETEVNIIYEDIEREV